MVRTTIAFADDHPALLKGIESLFREDDRFEIVGAGHSADEATELAAKCQPDVFILDLSMPGDVYGAIQRMTGPGKRTKVVVFTAHSSTDLARKALNAGASAFVLKGRPADELYSAVDAVSDGEVFLSPGFADRMIAEGGQNLGNASKPPKLSRREIQVVHGVFGGKTNREIAISLGLTEKTIKHYMTNLMIKLQVKNRVEVVLAARVRLMEPSELPPA